MTDPLACLNCGVNVASPTKHSYVHHDQRFLGPYCHRCVSSTARDELIRIAEELEQ